MDVFTMVTLIVLASCGAGVINNYLKVKGKQDKNLDHEDTLSELDELRRRVEVLEEIVTDQKYQLQNDIAALERGGNSSA